MEPTTETPDEASDGLDLSRVGLALCEAFRDFPGSYIAPAIPRPVILGAIQTYLHLQDDETLLAVIVPTTGSQTSGGCALTSKRIYWVGRPSRQRSARTSSGPTRSQSLAYTDLPESIGLTGGPSRAIDLGEGRKVKLGGDRPLQDQVIKYLQSMRSLARDEATPGGLLEPQLGWLRQDWHDVLGFSAWVREAQAKLHDFNERLYRTSNIVVTPVLVVACVALYAIMVATGVSPTDPSQEAMIAWGANDGPMVVGMGEWWRLFTAIFLHIGAIHLAMNMWCLIAGGRVIERLFGPLSFAALYVLSGLGASITSLYVHPTTPSAGASGAIFGIFGALLGFVAVQRNVPREALKRMRAGVLICLGYNLIIGLAVPMIDMAGHMGGLVTGFVVGLVMTLVSPSKGSKLGGLWRCFAVAVFSVLLGLFARGAIDAARVRLLADPDLAPLLRNEPDAVTAWNEFSEAAAPILPEFSAIDTGLPGLTQDINSRVIPRSVLIQRLDDLASRQHPLQARIAAVPVANDEIRAVRDCLAAAQTHQSATLDALKRFLQTRDEKHILGPAGSADSFAAYEKDLKEFDRLSNAYFTSHGLTRKAP